MAEERMLNDEILLGLIKANGGGGGGGTTNYNDLSNQPQINGNTLTGNKSASDLGLVAAVDGKGLSTNDYTDADKAIVDGVTAALAGKQDTLTVGDYIDITSGEISVNREIPNETVSYEFKTKGTSEPNIAIIVTKRSNSSVVWEREYQYLDVLTPIVIDDVIKFGYQWVNAGQWTYEMLVASDSHAVGYRQSWGYLETKDYTEDFSLIDNTGLKLIIKSEMDTALAGKQNTLTFDSVPTDGSTNPVESNGIYDALALKQNATDNSLETDAKTIVGAINEHEGDVSSLKSGLTNVADDVKLNTNDLTTPSRTKNILPMTVKGIKEQNTVGTWSGNNYVYNFITFTIQTDSDDNVIGIIINGTSTGDTYFYMPSTFLPGSYKVSAAQSGTTTRFTINVNGTIVANIDYDDNPFALTVNNNDTVEMYIKVLANTSNTNNSVKPIVVDFTETDITFAPYIPSVESRIEAVESGLTNVELSFQSHDVSGADIAEILTNLLLWVRDSLVGGRTYVLSGVFTNTTSTSSEDYNAVITKKSTHMYGMVSSGNFIYNTNYTAGVYRGLYKFEGTSLI